MSEESKWWKEISVYQVYPRSFKDSNGDGIGDINGITESLDYIKGLGVDCIWLSPVYPTPNEDNGYDISDYLGIDKEFGTMQDWERFAEEAHSRGLKIVMDIVVNHTSDQHPWFKEARKSRDNPYREYYMWSEGKDGKEPNNWVSFFSGSVWQKNEATDDYYLHLFAKGQPDLNWESQKVRDEVKNIIHYWAQKKVDGFRLDVINCISKVPGYPDAVVVDPNEQYHWASDHFTNGPRFMEFMHEIKRDAFDKYEVFTVGETPFVLPHHGLQFTHAKTGVVNMLFQFELMGVDSASRFEPRPWKLSNIKNITDKWQLGLEGGWNSNYLENHDQPRSVSRFGCLDTPELRVRSAKMLMTWLVLLKGTPYIYQGQELGLTNPRYTLDQYVDIKSVNWMADQRRKGQLTDEELLYRLYNRSRDNSRTPMPWSDEENGGFCSNETRPWVALHPQYREINVADALADPNSTIHHLRKLLALRKQFHVAIYGDYRMVAKDNDKVYAYLRTDTTGQLLVASNFFNEDAVVSFNEEDAALFKNREGKLLLSNHESTASAYTTSSPLKLKPYEAVIYSFHK